MNFCGRPWPIDCEKNCLFSLWIIYIWYIDNAFVFFDCLSIKKTNFILSKEVLLNLVGKTK
jgi:hypothetical protein